MSLPKRIVMTRNNYNDIIQFNRVEKTKNLYDMTYEEKEGEGFMYTQIEDIITSINRNIDLGFKILEMK